MWWLSTLKALIIASGSAIPDLCNGVSIMHAWQSVKVTNKNSKFVDQAGYVIRTEIKNDKPSVVVRLDLDGKDHVFKPEDLEILK